MRILPWPAAPLIAFLIFLPRAGSAQQGATNAQQALVDSANHERTARGLPPLRWDASLARAARQHALRMARENTISHQFQGEPDLAARAARAGSRFTSIAENVAEGPSVASIHRQWMNSAPHRANLLDPELNSIGTAVSARGGQLFAAEDFSNAAGETSFDEQEKQVGALLQARGLFLLFNTDDARRTCALSRGYPAERRPLLVLRYESGTLNRLPAEIEKKIADGKYHSAAVGVCSSSNPSEFVSYRVAVLLY